MRQLVFKGACRSYWPPGIERWTNRIIKHTRNDLWGILLPARDITLKPGYRYSPQIERKRSPGVAKNTTIECKTFLLVSKDSL